MSKAPRPATWKTRSRTWAGQRWWLGQRRSLSPSFCCASVVPHDGHVVGIFHFRRPSGRSGEHRPDDLGDDVAGLAQDRRCRRDGRPCAATSWALCRVAFSTVDPATRVGSITPYGVDPTRAADVDPDLEQLGVDLLGRVLERDRPARRPRRRAEPALERHLVDLHDHAVDLVGDDRVAVLAGVLDVGLDLLERRQHPDLRRRSAGPRRRAPRRRGTAPSARSRARSPMPWQTMPRSRVAVTRGSFWRSEPAAALRGLANTGLPASVIDSLSRSNASRGRNTSPRTSSRPGHRELVGAGQPVRHRVDGLHVGGDVLAGAAVAAGERPDQPTVLVEQVDRQAVDLELAQQRRRRRRPRGRGGRTTSRARRRRRRCRGDSIRWRWSTAVNSVETAPPTFWVGESGVRSSGNSSSRACSSRSRTS